MSGVALTVTLLSAIETPAAEDGQITIVRHGKTDARAADRSPAEGGVADIRDAGVRTV
jgi:hypothetical protein